MKIIVKFLNGNDYWQAKVLKSAEDASKFLSDPAFLAKVREVPKFDCTDDSPTLVGNKLMTTPIVTINIGFYSKWWTRAIAYEAGGSVYFNTRKENYGAGGPGNIAHETMHALGWSHRGNSPSGNQNTVPWLIGAMVEAELQSRSK